MNQIKSIQRINQKELDVGILSEEQSWHHEYKDQAYIYIGGLPRDLTEADILTVFSQFGIPVDIFLVRDHQSGESKGFAYLKYEDQRSTILAVDNLNGTKLNGNTIHVDHTFFEPREEAEEYREAMRKELSKDFLDDSLTKTKSNKLLPIQSKKIKDPELEDPMANYKPH
ncbi:U2 snRNP complex subunit IST3 NDAI_0A02810 [Naumovozyma dairenensis CBS 421]|uniref:RRM domain-containing protein n=1 Tax=Naumovozyma dairenensis (strain ATCC 10597 / BCRC 20456 / CBS 421 / NBRC 0211 / NRRL Y-12639) TaxID=1071378 RepID=G0W3Q0_NAUDC|nr:hypothetical protein NDAI_0A02810 [Naumovozyma dairenensis CBS 421]CCD22438.1 hypothetical protein NDAI_0A02810 [Naumovozyma dairenensis CBS 421]